MDVVSGLLAKAKPSEQNGLILVTVLGFVEIVAIIVCGVFLGLLVGDKDSSNDLGKIVIPVTGGLGAIVMIHTLLWYFYSIYNPLSMNLYYLLATSFTMLVSLTALAIAIVNKR